MFVNYGKKSGKIIGFAICCEINSKTLKMKIKKWYIEDEVISKNRALIFL